jgi:mono/diheme cytochrome c family protein
MRTLVATLATAILLVVFCGIAFIYSGAYYIGADQPHWAVTHWLFEQARTRSIHFHARDIAVPAGLDNQTLILAGVTHFAEHCVVCHGAPGVERGDIAAGLSPHPPNLADAAGFYTPGELFWIVKHGIRMTGMPAWGDHSDDELWATVALIEKLPGMTEQDYAKLIAASQAQGEHHHEGREAQPQPGMAQPPGTLDHDHPAGHHH